MGKQQGCSGSGKGRRKSGQRLYCGFHGKEWERQVTKPGLNSLNNFSGLGVIGVVPSYLAPIPGVIRGEEDSSKNVRAREGRQVASCTQDWLVCMSKVCSQASGLLSLGLASPVGAVSLSVRPQMPIITWFCTLDTNEKRIQKIRRYS